MCTKNNQHLWLNDGEAELTYFYHPDHLGSASWITDLSGQPVQHLQYMPFGGDYIDQQDPNTEYSERFRFTGKERDAETGYDYFGARYYSSSVGIWLSVDPMSDKYPSLSPYVYCADNPMRLVDLEGTDIFEYNDILVQGMNNSSITIKTNLVDMKVNAQPLGIDFGGNFQLEGYEVLSAALDLAGIVDPTGIADGANAVLQAKSREYFNAAISAAGLLPYIGDIAKVGKIKKDIQIIEKAIDAKSINQLNDIIKRGKAPKNIIRFDNPKIHSEKPHVHFSDGTALNKDGTWKHNNSNHKFINEEIEFLQNNGWKLP